MFSLITKYLLQHKRVSIPQVGSFELKSIPPELDIADKKLLAPVFITEYSTADEVTEHQFRYFSQAQGADKERVEQDLRLFGQRLKEALRRRSVNWNGFGTLQAVDKSIVFEPEEIRLACLQPLDASRVIRQNAGHRVLVGEQDLSSQQATDILQQDSQPPVKRSYANLIGWIVLALVLLLVGYLLYKRSFAPQGAGLQQRIGWSFTQSR